jgi:hypothetical protein
METRTAQPRNVPQRSIRWRPFRLDYLDGDVDQSTWNTGVIAAAILAALVVVGFIVWAATDDEDTGTNSPPTTMGRAPRPPAR